MIVEVKLHGYRWAFLLASNLWKAFILEDTIYTGKHIGFFSRCGRGRNVVDSG
jgi:hypothetical protein